jgi:adenosylhomocysteine nucleosidase
MSVMRQEIESLVVAMGATAEVVQARMTTYYKGILWGRPVVLVFSGWGEVAAATTATYLIEQFGVERILFTGVAGAADWSLKIGVDGFLMDAELRQEALGATQGFFSEGLRSQVAAEDVRRLKDRLPNVACVETEGAAVAEVCYEYGVPLVVVRTVSDSADESAPIEFRRFIARLANAYAHGILKNLVLSRSLTKDDWSAR